MDINKSQKNRRLPDWFRMQRASGPNYTKVKKLVEERKLHTICTSGNCPNIGECWNAGTATFMILGGTCTRACKFCGVPTGRPDPPDKDETARLAESIKLLGIRHCVITSVDRDDLPDSGAGFWAETIKTVKKVNPGVTIETLIPDFNGVETDIMKVVNAGPEVISHNLETVERLTPRIRTKAMYRRSLEVIRILSDKDVMSKSGIMLGLGEKDEEVYQTMDDLRNAGCRVLTIGQYLRPSFDHMEVVEYVRPERFDEYRKKALERGFDFVESSPLVRSSYHAERHAGQQVTKWRKAL